MDVLQLDVSGRPQAWISAREAAVLYACDSVAWTLGDAFQVLRGGVQRATGLQSRIELHPILVEQLEVSRSRQWVKINDIACIAMPQGEFFRMKFARVCWRYIAKQGDSALAAESAAFTNNVVKQGHQNNDVA